MPRKYRHIKDDEKKLIEYKTGNHPLFYAVCTIRSSLPITVCFFTIMLW